MVNIVMGPEGSGKTKLLIDAISRALKTEVPESVYEELAALCEKMGNEA